MKVPNIESLYDITDVSQAYEYLKLIEQEEKNCDEQLGQILSRKDLVKEKVTEIEAFK